jgi:short-subunit dehydrogenase
MSEKRSLYVISDKCHSVHNLLVESDGAFPTNKEQTHDHQAFTTSLNHELADRGIRAQAVLPGATRTDFWALGGLPVEHLPTEIVMQAEDMVDAALAGLDQGETSTIPALRDIELWNAYEAARLALGPQLSATRPAPRFTTAA